MRLQSSWTFLVLSTQAINAANPFIRPETLSVLERDSQNCTNGTYTAPDGLQFEMACEVDYPYDNLKTDLTLGNVYECMNSCSNMSNALCWGVSFNTNDGSCYFKNASVEAIASSSTGFHSALVPKYLFDVNDTSCGYDNLTQTTVNNAEFQIYCNTGLIGDDLHPIEGADYNHPYHADSLEECMDKCSSSHPLCEAVAWNVDMVSGWANCYPKTSQTGTYFGPITDHVSHVALLNIPTLQNTCETGANFTASEGSIFSQRCFSTNGGSNVSSIHTATFEACMNKCEANSSCLAIVWDSTLQDGYQNCYLKADIDQTTATTYSDYALKLSNGTTSSSDSDDSDTSSNAWIAGPVVGGVAVLALLGAGLWWWRRRRNRRDQAFRDGKESQFQNLVKPTGDLAELPYDHQRSELAAPYQSPTELP